MEVTNLLIADESRLFREGLRRILPEDKFNIVGELNSLVEVLTALRNQPHPISLVIGGPSADTLVEFETLKLITQQFSDLKMVLLAEKMVPGLLEMALDSGASGFLSKNISPEALLYSLEIVLLGEQIFPTHLPFLYEKAPRSPFPILLEDVGAYTPLSSRESQILGCLVNGSSNKTIARELNMAEATVKVHLKSLLRKLKATNRTQAAIRGLSSPALLIAKIKQGIETPDQGIVSKMHKQMVDCEAEDPVLK